jgi:carbamoyl-phosphate synthase small subunit
MHGILQFQDGTIFEGISFGYEGDTGGELVFTTGMVGYPESLTDPSYAGQILFCTYPLVGNYGVPSSSYWESYKIHAAGLVVSTYNETPSHWQSEQSLSAWLKDQKVPALQIKDTRKLAQKIRDEGAQLARISIVGAGSKPARTAFWDPNKENLVAQVSTAEPYTVGEYSTSRKKKQIHIGIIDCGVKQNITRSLVSRGVKVTVVPWDYDIFQLDEQIDGVVISNGPGDPKMVPETVKTVQEVLKHGIPTLGICLGNQILALAAGGDTYKLKFGHRSQNQPSLLEGTKRCYLTTQNHGFAVGDIPKGYKPWFTNANDNTNEGIIHTSKPFMSVQFHPEACPGPVDTNWVFDYYLEKVGL